MDSTAGRDDDRSQDVPMVPSSDRRSSSTASNVACALKIWYCVCLDWERATDADLHCVSMPVIVYGAGGRPPSNLHKTTTASSSTPAALIVPTPLASSSSPPPARFARDDHIKADEGLHGPQQVTTIDDAGVLFAGIPKTAQARCPCATSGGNTSS